VHPAYRDVLEAAGRPPRWWDSNGVPRFAPFHPNLLGVYDQLAVLVEIACQSCHARFLVGAGARRFDIYPGSAKVAETDLAGFASSYDYGDPPRHSLPGRPGDRCAGETMSSEATFVVEAWEQVGFEWVHRPEHTGPILDAGAT